MTKLKFTLEADIRTENQELSIEITEDNIRVRDEAGAFILDMYRDDFRQVLGVLAQYAAATGTST